MTSFSIKYQAQGGICLDMCARMWGSSPEADVGVSLSLLRPQFESEFLTELGAPWPANTKDSPWLCLHGSGIRANTALLGVLYPCWRLNSGSPGCMVGTLPTEPHPQPLGVLKQGTSH